MGLMAKRTHECGYQWTHHCKQSHFVNENSISVIVDLVLRSISVFFLIFQMFTHCNLLPLNLFFFFHFIFENANFLRILTFGKSRFYISFLLVKIFTFWKFDLLKNWLFKNVYCLIHFVLDLLGFQFLGKKFEADDFLYIN